MCMPDCEFEGKGLGDKELQIENVRGILLQPARERVQSDGVICRFGGKEDGREPVART